MATTPGYREYTHPDYLDSRVKYWVEMGSISPDVPNEVHIRRSLAFSFDHSSPNEDHVANLKNLIIAHAAANKAEVGSKTTYSVYAVAFSPRDRILPRYANSAPNKNTKPAVGKARREADTEYRLEHAFPDHMGTAPPSFAPHGSLHCAEYLALPSLIQCAKKYYTGEDVLITALAMTNKESPKPFCENCKRYVTEQVEQAPGLRIVDGSNDQVYQSRSTVFVPAEKRTRYETFATSTLVLAPPTVELDLPHLSPLPSQ